MRVANRFTVARFGLSIAIGPQGASASSSAAEVRDWPAAGSSIRSKSFIVPRIVGLFVCANTILAICRCCMQTFDLRVAARGRRSASPTVQVPEYLLRKACAQGRIEHRRVVNALWLAPGAVAAFARSWHAKKRENS